MRRTVPASVLVLCVASSFMLSSCGPPKWKLAIDDSVPISLDGSTRTVAVHHILGAVSTAGCERGCVAYLRVEAEIERGSTEDARMFVVPDDPEMEPWDHWRCDGPCAGKTGFSTYFPADGCAEEPCTLGHTVEIESSEPLSLWLRAEVAVHGPAEGYYDDPPPGISAGVAIE